MEKWLDDVCEFCGRKHRNLKGRFHLSEGPKGETVAYRWAGPRVMEDDPQSNSRTGDYCLELWQDPSILEALALHDGIEIEDLH